MSQAARMICAVATWAAIFPAVPIAPVAAAEERIEPGAAEREREVRRLIEELGGETRAGRAAAEKRLLEMGPGVLPLLPAPELLPSVSVRAAVERVRVELERRQAKESSQSSRVTAAGTRPLAAWAAEIGRQTGNVLDPSALPESAQSQRVTLDLEDKPFWPALDALAKEARIAYRLDPDARGIRLVEPGDERKSPEPSVGYAGPFRLAVLSAKKRPRFGGGDRQILRVEVGLTAEPRLRPLFLQYAAADQKAIDRSGAVLAPFSPSANIEAPLGDGRKQSRLQLDFDLPQAEIGPTVDLRGKLRLMTAAGSAAIRFGNLDKLAREKSLAIARRRGGVTVTLERVELERVPDDRQQARVRISVTYDSGGPAFESHRTWILHNEVYLETPGGERIALNGGVEMTLQADGAVGLEYTFARLPRDLAGYAFVYIVPTLIVDVPIEYEIQSVRVAGE